MLKIFELQLLLIEKYIFTVNTVTLDLQLFLFLELNWKCDIAKKKFKICAYIQVSYNMHSQGFCSCLTQDPSYKQSGFFSFCLAIML